MSNRNLFIIAALVGSTAGGFIPGLWGAGMFSGWGILLSTVGGILAVWVAYKYVS
jgi:uncharacterized membrane protein YeaQ/YmgE (transglycosylase-associated protein family)